MQFALFVCMALTGGGQSSGDSIIVPIGGNTWKSPKEAIGGSVTKAGGRVTNEGIRNWSDKNVSFTTYVRIGSEGSLKVGLKLAVPEGVSELEVLVRGRGRKVTVREDGLSPSEADKPETAEVGEWQLRDTGYTAITLRGLSRTGTVFANISEIVLSGTAINEQAAYVKNNEGNYFYWGRRGPSVHLSYPVPEDTETEWFYNEVTVPEGEDVRGSYFMAAGFAEGYFGFQVNSPEERRILFSVWSPFKTDNPEDIPEHQRIILLKKGKDVYVGEFGNEGSGGQSYLRYNWKAGETYKFLLHGKPDTTGNTTYTAFFYAPEEKKWRLIASFRRPQTTTWLKRLHSFLENFIPATGDVKREVQFANQWIRDRHGAWTELTRARLTGDNTARMHYRMDYAGGFKNGSFYLKNCGFFSDYTPLDTWYERSAAGKEPNVDTEALLLRASF